MIGFIFPVSHSLVNRKYELEEDEKKGRKKGGRRRHGKGPGEKDGDERKREELEE